MHDHNEAVLRVCIAVITTLEKPSEEVIVVQVVVRTPETLHVTEQLVFVHFAHFLLEGAGGHMTHEEAIRMIVSFKSPERVGLAIQVLTPVVRV
jgi:hypothetical protein